MSIGAPGAGAPPHRHSGPVFGYMVEGEMIFELEGEPERVIRAGEAFWEPGGDVIHYQAANNLSDRTSRFVAFMVCAAAVAPTAGRETDACGCRPGCDCC